MVRGSQDGAGRLGAGGWHRYQGCLSKLAAGLEQIGSEGEEGAKVQEYSRVSACEGGYRRRIGLAQPGETP